MQQNDDPFLKGLSNVSNKHLKLKDSLFETLTEYFDRDLFLAGLAKKYSVPQDPHSFVAILILLTRGSKTDSNLRS